LEGISYPVERNEFSGRVKLLGGRAYGEGEFGGENVRSEGHLSPTILVRALR
jgi:hypothetical protein